MAPLPRLPDIGPPLLFPFRSPPPASDLALRCRVPYSRFPPAISLVYWMVMSPQHEENLASLLKENIELARENNRLLKKMHRNAVIGTWLTVLWYAILIGLPFVLYFYILEPYFGTLQESFEQFRVGAGGPFPGLEMLESYLEKKQFPGE